MEAAALAVPSHAEQPTQLVRPWMVEWEQELEDGHHQLEHQRDVEAEEQVGGGEVEEWEDASDECDATA